MLHHHALCHATRHQDNTSLRLQKASESSLVNRANAKRPPEVLCSRKMESLHTTVTQT